MLFDLAGLLAWLLLITFPLMCEGKHQQWY
jgi:hypothetical protein